MLNEMLEEIRESGSRDWAYDIENEICRLRKALRLITCIDAHKDTMAAQVAQQIAREALSVNKIGCD